MKSQTSLFTLVLTILLFVTASGAGVDMARPGTKAPDFMLQDQNDNSVALRQFEGRVVVLIACDRKGKFQNPAWIKAIKEKYGRRIAAMGVADVRSVPFFLKGKIKNDMKRDYIDRVLLDWTGEFFAAYGLAEGSPNIIVIDRSGVIRLIQVGPAAPDAVQRVFSEIDKLEPR